MTILSGTGDPPVICADQGNTGGSPVPQPKFIDAWRRRKSAAFHLPTNSTAGRVVSFDLWGRRVHVYANANLSIYSAQRCNAACPFCVEELRPASRGIALEVQKSIEPDDGRYFTALEDTLAALRPVPYTISITGGEPSKDPRLPRILRTVAPYRRRRKTITTNGSGLLDLREARRVIDWIVDARLDHLNISMAADEIARNATLMRLREGLSIAQLRDVVRIARDAGVRVRLSCVLLRGGVETLDDVRRYLDFARSLGVDNLIFRQLMKTDPQTHAENFVVRFSDERRVMLEPLLDRISDDRRFRFTSQVMGYYYYVEVWRFEDSVDVVFEEADLAQLERVKQREPNTFHELIFHPNALLASTWQPWDGVLGPCGNSLKI